MRGTNINQTPTESKTRRVKPVLTLPSAPNKDTPAYLSAKILRAKGRPAGDETVHSGHRVGYGHDLETSSSKFSREGLAYDQGTWPTGPVTWQLRGRSDRHEDCQGGQRRQV